MADDELKWLEGALGALNGGAGAEGGDIVGARCPKCNASDFAKVSDLYAESMVRLEEPGETPDPALTGGLTDAQILQKFTPPRRNSAAAVAVGLGVPLAVASFFLARRYGETVGQISFGITLVGSAMVLMTMLRSFSDQYYHRRRRWNRMYVCRKCGQVIAA